MKEDIILERIFVALKHETYAEIMRGEIHHNHIVVETAESGTWRWKAYPERRIEIMQQFGAKDMNDLFARCGADKNDPLVRELYRCMGYSLSGYHEIFYWKVNHHKADEWDPTPYVVGEPFI